MIHARQFLEEVSYSNLLNTHRLDGIYDCRHMENTICKAP